MSDNPAQHAEDVELECPLCGDHYPPAELAVSVFLTDGVLCPTCEQSSPLWKWGR